MYMISAKGSLPVDNENSAPVEESFFDKIGPGGIYFRYSEITIAVLGLIFLGLLTMILLPYLTGGQFQNPVSHLFGNLPIKNKQSKGLPSGVQKIVYPLASGKQTWQFSRGGGVTGPNLQTATVDPLDPAKGATQTITATAQNGTPIIKITATLYTDNQSLSQDMKLTGGINTNGTWATSWKMTDTYDFTYHIDFVLYSGSGNWNGALTFR